jgi:hypothetical protein
VSDVRARVAAVKSGTATPRQILQEVARVKAEEIVRDWANNPGKNAHGVLALSTTKGPATIGHIRYFSAPGDGIDGVEVWTGPNEGNPPTFRLINPPLLAADPNGDILVPIEGTNRVSRYRVDPLHAIAEFIAAHAGKAEKG